MSFQTAITIKSAIERIDRGEYVLPAIQREFVWGTDQIVGLFDSLMRGYPIGSFLFWKVDKEHCGEFTFYGFLRAYHERDSRHNQKVNLLGAEAVTAILDGQQRLTSLYIGLKGTYAEKVKWKRRTTETAYPKRRLYVNLLAPAGETEEGLKFDLRFLTDHDAQGSESAHWFPVGGILKFEDLGAIIDYVVENKLTDTKFPKDCLVALFRAICDRGLINYYEETEQNLDKVLNIFVRINSGGTPLVYSDILLSIATAQWKRIDAREVTHELVDELNRTPPGFAVNKDFVLKSCLVLADISDVKFNVLNFKRENMDRMEEAWPQIQAALRMAVRLVASFGFHARTLTANYSLLPIAYYLLRRGLPANYVDASAFAEDRAAIRSWLIRALLKRGTFGSGLDSALARMRDAIAEKHDAFPTIELEERMAKLGKSLKFDEEEVEELLNLEYGQGQTFGVLALLYPDLDFRDEWHEDHIFPRSRFTAARLRDAGVPPTQIEAYLEACDCVANLQLLRGTPNKEKLARMPDEWIAATFQGDARRLFMERNHLPEVPATMAGFLEFYEARRVLLKARLMDLLVTKRRLPPPPPPPRR